jgi:3-oxo-5-alpha-steroid 4-dehydrogenase 3 / polyprenol reductase
MSVPQRWFLHFYLAGSVANALALGLMAFGGIGVPAAAARTKPPLPPLLPSVADAQALAALLLFQLHLVRRALETALLLEYPPGSRMHAIAYAFGMSYYLVVPLSLLPRGWSGRVAQWAAAAAAAARLLSSAAAPGAIGTAVRARFAAVAASLASSPAWRMHLAGILLFLAANALQLASHAALARLSRRQQQQARRRGKEAAAAAVPRGGARSSNSSPLRARRRGAGQDEGDGDDHYALPTGPLFALVSCPHYSAEVLLYAALALLTRLRDPLPLLMAAWVAFNLALAARATHAWYARRFGAAYYYSGGVGGGRGGGGNKAAPGLPWWRRRRALVPFLF